MIKKYCADSAQALVLLIAFLVMALPCLGQSGSFSGSGAVSGSGQAGSNVIGPQLQSLTVSPDNGMAQVGSAVNYNVVGTFTDGSTADMTAVAVWTSSNTTIASPGVLNAGLIPYGCNNPGTATVTATIGPIFDTAQITCTAASLPLQITTLSLPSAIQNQFYQAQLNAQNGILPYTWTIASGSISPLQLNSVTGLISGTPTQTATLCFVPQVTDSEIPPVTVPGQQLCISVNPSQQTGLAQFPLVFLPYSNPLQCGPAVVTKKVCTLGDSQCPTTAGDFTANQAGITAFLAAAVADGRDWKATITDGANLGHIVLPLRPAGQTSCITLQPSGLAQIVGPGYGPQAMKAYFENGQNAADNAHRFLLQHATGNVPAVDVALSDLQGNVPHHYRIIGAEIEGQHDTFGLTTVLVRFGNNNSNQNQMIQEPHDLALEKSWIHGTPDPNNEDIVHAITLAGQRLALVDNVISDVHAPGQDAQDISVANGEGPGLIQNNYTSATTENVLFGGNPTAVPNALPCDFYVAGNYMTKDLNWLVSNPHGFSIKNIYEMKTGCRTLVEGNIFENSWAAGQSGGLILFQVVAVNTKDQTIHDITFRNNIVRHGMEAFDGMNLGGDTSHGNISIAGHHVSIYNNLFYDISTSRMLGLAGRGFYSGAGTDTFGQGTAAVTSQSRTATGDTTATLTTAPPQIKPWLYTSITNAAGGEYNGTFLMKGSPSTTTATYNATGEPPLFGMHVHGPGMVPWLSTNPQYIRGWGWSAYWGNMSTQALGDGNYNFNNLDQYYNAVALGHGAHLGMTMTGSLPGWITTSPTAACPIPTLPGSCFPPNDVNADGTGTDAHAIAFFTALGNHIQALDAGHNLWEWFGCGNEPQATYWHGTDQQLWRICNDLHDVMKSINPNWLIVSPEPSGGINSVGTYFSHFLGASNANLANFDVMGFHCYSYPQNGVPNADDVVPLVENMLTQFRNFGVASKPMWCTEGSWGAGTGFTVQACGQGNSHCGWILQHYLLQRALGVERYYWWAEDQTAGNGLLDSSNAEEPSVTALTQGINWITGATFTAPPYQDQSQVWHLPIQRPGGYQAEINWTRVGAGIGTVSVTAPIWATQYRDDVGGVHVVTGGTTVVVVGYDPIIWESTTNPGTGGAGGTSTGGTAAFPCVSFSDNVGMVHTTCPDVLVNGVPFGNGLVASPGDWLLVKNCVQASFNVSQLPASLTQDPHSYTLDYTLSSASPRSVTTCQYQDHQGVGQNVFYNHNAIYSRDVHTTMVNLTFGAVPNMRTYTMKNGIFTSEHLSGTFGVVVTGKNEGTASENFAWDTSTFSLHHLVMMGRNLANYTEYFGTGVGTTPPATMWAPSTEACTGVPSVSCIGATGNFVYPNPDAGGAINKWQSVSGTATLTFNFPHDFIVGQTIKLAMITGITNDNGSHVILSAPSNLTLTYASAYTTGTFGGAGQFVGTGSTGHDYHDFQLCHGVSASCAGPSFFAAGQAGSADDGTDLGPDISAIDAQLVNPINPGGTGQQILSSVTALSTSNGSGCAGNGSPTNGCNGGFVGLSTAAGNTHAQTQTPDVIPNNVSSVPIADYLYAGATTKVDCYYQPWFYNFTPFNGHVNISMDESNGNSIAAQAMAMATRGCNTVVIDYYGTDATQSFNKSVTDALATYLAANPQMPLKLGIMPDQGMLKPFCPTSVNDQTACLISAYESQLDTIDSLYGSKSFYATDGSGRPLLWPFITPTTWHDCAHNSAPCTDFLGVSGIYATVLAYAHSHYSKAYQILDRFGSFSSLFDGEYGWPQPPTYSDASPNSQRCWDSIAGGTTCNWATGVGTGTSYVQTLYTACKANPTKHCDGILFKSFDWSNANWNLGVQKIIQQGCGNVPNLLAAKLNSNFSTTTQLERVGWATWNDYEEGHEIETGIDNCARPTALITAPNQLGWLENPTDTTYWSENTIKDWQIWYELTPGSGTLVLAMSGIAPSVSTEVLSNIVPVGTHNVYLLMEGKSGIINRLAGPVSYTH